MQEVHAGAERIALRGPPVQLSKTQFLIGLTVDQTEVARQYSVDRAALFRGGWCAASYELLCRAINDAGPVNAGRDREVSPRSIEIEEIEQLIPTNSAAGAEACLMANFGGIEARVPVARVERAVAEKPIERTVEVVAAAPRDCVHYAARCAAVFRREVRRQHLKLLHGILRNLRSDAGTSGVLVKVLLGRVAAIEQEGIAACYAAECQHAEGAVVCNARCEQHERVDAAAVDWQTGNLSYADDLRHPALRVFHNSGGVSKIDIDDGPRYRESDVEVEVRAHFQLEVVGVISGEPGSVDGDTITTGWRERGRGKNADPVGGEVADNAFRFVGDNHTCIRNDCV